MDNIGANVNQHGDNPILVFEFVKSSQCSWTGKDLHVPGYVLSTSQTRLEINKQEKTNKHIQDLGFFFCKDYIMIQNFAHRVTSFLMKTTTTTINKQTNKHIQDLTACAPDA